MDEILTYKATYLSTIRNASVCINVVENITATHDDFILYFDSLKSCYPCHVTVTFGNHPC